MGSFTDIQVTGLAELKQRLERLPQAIQTKIVKGMVASGAAVIKNEAIRYAPYYTGDVQKGHPPPGTLKDAIYQKRVTKESIGSREVWSVNVSREHAYYATWVEYGHMFVARFKGKYTDYEIRGKGRLTGLAGRRAGATEMMPPRPYMRPAFEASWPRAVDVMGTYLAYALPDVVRQL